MCQGSLKCALHTGTPQGGRVVVYRWKRLGVRVEPDLCVRTLGACAASPANSRRNVPVLSSESFTSHRRPVVTRHRVYYDLGPVG